MSIVTWLGGPPVVAQSSRGSLVVADLGETDTGTFCGETAVYRSCGG